MAASRSKGKGKANGMLARRKAALERAALRVAEQRRVAAEAEAERLRKETAFDELAADFELAVEDEQAVAAEVEEELRRVRERGQVRIDAARVEAARVVQAMGKDETVAGCAQRLGVGVERIKELRRLGREALAGDGAGTESGKTAAPQKAAATGGEQREGGRAAGAAPVVAPPVTPPSPAPSVAAPTAPTAPPAGPSQAPGPVGGGGARPGWPESSR
ncbi:hypothetical protein ACIQGT_26075 [Streptomyces sp. NPDC093108]|uniref:hypothetical protein n=1 Tax=Streptomyces sp. NPDC093108 TaxID=3366030 RepID=UPI00382BE53E